MCVTVKGYGGVSSASSLSLPAAVAAAESTDDDDDDDDDEFVVTRYSRRSDTTPAHRSNVHSLQSTDYRYRLYIQCCARYFLEVL